MIPIKEDNPHGFHKRYHIQKITGYVMHGNVDGTFYEAPLLHPVDPVAEYFVLRLDEASDDIEHLKACRVAIQVYANMIAHKYPQLANDLRTRYPLILSLT